MKHEHALAEAVNRGAASAAAPSPLAAGSYTYVNELGSTMTFTLNADGTIAGTYTSTVSGTGRSITGTLSGTFRGYLISWIVTWPTNPPAMTAWVGEYILTNGPDNIETMWYLITQTPNAGDPSQFWSAVNAGSDLFTPK